MAITGLVTVVKPPVDVFPNKRWGTVAKAAE